jgi:hypothetical protein
LLDDVAAFQRDLQGAEPAPEALDPREALDK